METGCSMVYVILQIGNGDMLPYRSLKKSHILKETIPVIVGIAKFQIKHMGVMMYF